MLYYFYQLRFFMRKFSINFYIYQYIDNESSSFIIFMNIFLKGKSPQSQVFFILRFRLLIKI
jgi:hypothetical protein